MQKTLGIFIATPGRQSLYRTIQSIAYQQAPVEDILVVGDGYSEKTEHLVQTLALLYNVPARYVATTRTRDWGHSQQNYALQHVRGDYLIYQDDDDIFLPRALNECARLVSEFRVDQPLIGRVKTPNFGLLWQTSNPSDAVLDGHCIVVPNDKKKLGWFSPDYTGDQCYIHTTLRNYDSAAWTDRVWTLTRPEWKLHPLYQQREGDSWSWAFSTELAGPSVVHLSLNPEGEDSMRAQILGTRLSLGQWVELLQFAMYACQGKDLYISALESNLDLRLALKECNFKEHQRITLTETEAEIEYTHDWPPDFWPPRAPFTHLVGGDGEMIPDWRDPVWGGRRSG